MYTHMHLEHVSLGSNAGTPIPIVGSRRGARLHGLGAARATVLALALAGAAAAQDQPTFASASSSVEERLQASVIELAELQSAIAAEKVPLHAALNDVETELSLARAEFEQAARAFDTRTQALSNLRSTIKAGEEQVNYLTGLFGESLRKFETGLHIAELDRYQAVIDAARLTSSSADVPHLESLEAQGAILDAALARCDESLGGTRFTGAAVDERGFVRDGSFAMFGPCAFFVSADGSLVGSAEERLNSPRPTIVPYGNPVDAEAAGSFFVNGQGTLPLDPTLGNASKMEATSETFVEHVKKGGPVMIPIFAMAALALLVALYKWLSMALIARPSKRKLSTLLNAVADHDEDAARAAAGAIHGPTGAMLRAGTMHLGEPRELLEEVMYEKVLTAKLRLQGFLPFIAICAASAPLLGLLGTVTGIINTFKLITLFGSGDVKSLSGGISEALITTKFGLIVAIPSLLLHAFLSRKARGIVDQMETSAVAFMNQVARSRYGEPEPSTAPRDNGVLIPHRDALRTQVQEIVSELLGQAGTEQIRSERERRRPAPTQ